MTGRELMRWRARVFISTIVVAAVFLCDLFLRVVLSPKQRQKRREGGRL